MKLCECGCGLPAPIAKQTSIYHGHVKGQPVRFRHGHNSLRHGHDRVKQSPTYISWAMMLQRCTNAKAPNFSDYGGAGVKVCKRWRVFEDFLADMGPRPKGTTLGRFADTGDYRPSNVAWMTRKQQGRPFRFTPTQLADIRRRRMCGESFRSIGRSYGIVGTTVKKGITS